jgi:hypothetical protein
VRDTPHELLPDLPQSFFHVRFEGMGQTMLGTEPTLTLLGEGGDSCVVPTSDAKRRQLCSTREQGLTLAK